MIKLNIEGQEVEPKFTYALYKNITGKEREKRTENFNNFLNGIFNDDMNQIIYFYYCVAGGKLSEDKVVSQISNQKGFDNIHKVADEILQGFVTDGFFKTAVQQLLDSVRDSIINMQKASKISTLSKEDLEIGKIQIEQQQEKLSNMEKRIKK